MAMGAMLLFASSASGSRAAPVHREGGGALPISPCTGCSQLWEGWGSHSFVVLIPL